MSVRLIALPHPFNVSGRIVQELEPGPSLQDMLAMVQPDPALQHAVIQVQGVAIPRGAWPITRPIDGDLVTVRVVPAGSPEAIGTAGKVGGWAGVAMVVAGVVLLATGAGAVAGMSLIGAGLGMATAGFGVYTVLNLMSPQGKQADEDIVHSVRGGTNSPQPWGSVPVVLGHHLVVPPYGALPYTEIVGRDQYLRMLFILGYSPLVVDDLKIGDTLLSAFDDVDQETQQDATATALYTRQVTETALNIELLSGVNNVRTTEADTDEVSIDLTFPSGLFHVDDDGDKSSLSVEVTLEYAVSPAGAYSAWTASPVTKTAKDERTLRYGFRMAMPSRDTWDIRVKRVTADRDTADGDYDAVYWTAIRSIVVEDPVAASIRASVVRLALRIRATAQLSGVVNQLNAVCDSEVPTWVSGSGPAGWSLVEASSNPAALFLYMLRGAPNPNPVPDAMIDWPAIEDWYSWCASTGHACNAILSNATALRQVLADIASTGRASLAMRDGLYSVVVDNEKPSPVQLFTPRNSWGFEATKSFPDRPHALRLRFVSEPAGWQPDEVTVYDDGYDAGSATNLKTVDIWGVTDPDQVWKDGRYQLAAIRLRPEVYSWHADVESLVCQRGDRVLLQHDVALLGISSGRIKALTTDGGGDCDTITGDEPFEMSAGSYQVRIRKADGELVLAAVVLAVGINATVTLDPPIPAADIPAVGDLYSFGLVDLETRDLVVVGVELGQDLDAKLYAVDYAPAIFDADAGAIPAYNPGVTLPADYQAAPPAPSIVNIRSDGTVLLPSGGDFITRMMVTLAPGGSGTQLTTAYELEYRQNGLSAPWVRVGANADTEPTFSVTGVLDGVTYDVRARAQGAHGLWSDWTTTTHAVAGKTANPSDVSGLVATQTGLGTLLTWDAIPDLDVWEYEVREGASWAASTVLFRGSVLRHLVGHALPGAAITYRVKAIDTTGHYSTTEATVVVTPTNVNARARFAPDGYVGPRDYQSAGDGSDGATLQPILDAMSAAGGGVLELLPGTYLDDTGVEVPDDVQIIGPGDSSVWTFTAAAGSAFWINGSRIRLADFRLLGDDAGTDQAAIEISNVSVDVLVERLTIQDFGSWAITFQAEGGGGEMPERIRVRNNRLEGTSWSTSAIMILSGRYVTVADNDILGVSKTFSGWTSTWPGGGVAVGAGSSYAPENIVVEGNKIAYIDGVAVGVNVNSDADRAVSVVGNNIQHTGLDRGYPAGAINIVRCNGAVVSQNTIKDAQLGFGGGIRVGSLALSTVVFDNDVEDAGNLFDAGNCSTDGISPIPRWRGEIPMAPVNATAVQSTAERLNGLHSLLVTKTIASGTEARVPFQDNETTSDLHERVPGQTYDIEAWVKIPSSGGPAAAEVELVIRDYYSGAWHETVDAASVQDAWEKLTVSKTLNASAAGAEVFLRIASTAENTEYLYTDQVLGMHPGKANTHGGRFSDLGTGTKVL